MTTKPAVVSVIAPGAMGAAIGQRLVENGVEVRTSLAGRGAATQARATAAGMRAADADELLAADIILSVVPPGSAEALAQTVADAARRAADAGRPSRAVYVDCNAVNPATVQRIAARITAAGLDFVDGSLIGMPPRPGQPGAALFVSGPAAARVTGLAAAGIDLRVMPGPVGAASALKMAYGGTTKGLIAVGAAMLLAAGRGHVTEDLRAEFGRSQPNLLNGFQRSIPDMIPKAGRWVAEMEEIAAFLGEDTPAAQIYLAIARFYDHLAQADGAGDVAKLTRFFAPPSAGAR